MRVIDASLIAAFRSPGRCEHCGKWCQVREGAHIFARQRGNGGQVDIKENLVALGSTPMFQCPCHTRSGDGHEPTRATLLTIAAKREKTTAEAIEALVYYWRRSTLKKVWNVDTDGPLPDLFEEGE